MMEQTITKDTTIFELRDDKLITPVVFHRLYGADIFTLEDLSGYSEDQILGLEHVTEKKVAVLKGLLSEAGLSFSCTDEKVMQSYAWKPVKRKKGENKSAGTMESRKALSLLRQAVWSLSMVNKTDKATEMSRYIENDLRCAEKKLEQYVNLLQRHEDEVAV